MWWGIGIFGTLIYLVILFTAGLMTWRNRQWVMFVLGIFLPIFWVIGAFMAPKGRPARA